MLGSIDSFDYKHDDLCEYMERVELYFYVNGITDVKQQKAIFLLIIGSDAYNLLRNVFAPNVPASKSLKLLTCTLKEHLPLKSVLMAERYKFYSRDQIEGESISEYIIELQNLSFNCDFGIHLTDVLRDRFVCGLYKWTTRRKLLSDELLTLKKAVDLAIYLEYVESEKKTIGVEVTLQTSPRGKLFETTQCYRCHSKLHQASNCRFKDTTCYKCNSKGHLSKVCRVPK